MKLAPYQVEIISIFECFFLLQKEKLVNIVQFQMVPFHCLPLCILLIGVFAFYSLFTVCTYPMNSDGNMLVAKFAFMRAGFIHLYSPIN